MTEEAGPPVVRELVQPPTPWTALERCCDLPFVLFLDSAAREPERGRYSYLSAAPFAVFRARRDEWELAEAPRGEARLPSDAFRSVQYEVTDRGQGSPLEAVRDRFRRFRSQTAVGAPPFQGGAAGYFSYDLAHSLETLPRARWDEFGTDDIVLGFYDWTVAWDHDEGRAFVIANGHPATGDERSRCANARIDAVVRALADDRRRDPLPVTSKRIAESDLAPGHALTGWDGIRSDFSRDGYLAAVERAIEEICAGEVFQVNLSQRLLAPERWPPIEHYRRLREENPAPFAAYFHAGTAAIASSSPEQFLAVNGRRVVTRPIKGTRPRGHTAMADSFQGPALFESEKDRAENVMIVDLLRNDLSKVCSPGSVRVPRLFDIERHPTVYHLVSEVEGELRPDVDPFDLVAATFPGGSITGAPKVRAMEIISELEPTARGPYCGSLGWIGFNGDLSTNILIRTVTIAGGWLQIPVGGGIVAPSRPREEYEETLNKAKGMLRSLTPG